MLLFLSTGKTYTPEYVYPQMKRSLVITYSRCDLLTSSGKYTPYRTINISNDFLCNGMEILTISYDQTYTKIGRTIVYTIFPAVLI